MKILNDVVHVGLVVGAIAAYLAVLVGVWAFLFWLFFSIGASVLGNG